MAPVMDGREHRRKVSTRWQTVLPPEVRQDLGLRPGDEIAFEKVDGAWVIRPVVPQGNPYRKAIGALREHTRVRGSTREFLDEVRGPVETE